MKTIVLVLFLAALAFGQGQGQAVNQVQGPPPQPVLSLFYYDASNNLQYICYAPQNTNSTFQRRSDSTLTSIAVLTNVGTVTTASAHGLYVGARVTISGATVDTDLNGTYTVATVTSSNTYTIATVSVANATYTESTLVITTQYPLTTASKWAIQVLTHDGSNFLTASYWANASGPQINYGLACTARTSY